MPTTTRRRDNTGVKSNNTQHIRNGTGKATKKTRDQLKYIIRYSIVTFAFIGLLLLILGYRGSTNEADLEIKDDLDEGEVLLEKGRFQDSKEKFSILLLTHPKSPRALWGYARATEALWSRTRKNETLLSEAMTVMRDVITLPQTPRDLMKPIMRRLSQLYIVEKHHLLDDFWGFLSERFSRDVFVRHVFIYELRRNQKTWPLAEKYLREMMNANPKDCVTLAILGSMYSDKYNEHEKGAELMHRAIDLDCQGIRTTRHYLALGDAYIRLFQTDKAVALFKLGAERGIFLSRDQRSVHNAPGPITARPWWTYEQSTYLKDLKLLEDNWETIRDEGLAILRTDNHIYKDDAENLKDEGRWQKLNLYVNGKRELENCKRAPKTCKILSRIPDANTLTRGQIKFSVLEPGTHLWAHCGPTNCRIRAHLGLQIPEGPVIRVGNEKGTWVEGKFIIFDDSFEHEVWYNETEGSTQNRLVLIVDFWHPDITMEERKNIKPVK